METKHTPSALAWFLANQKLKENNQVEKEKVVLNDECGDSLWDEVLSQDNKQLNSKSDGESREVSTP